MWIIPDWSFIDVVDTQGRPLLCVCLSDILLLCVCMLQRSMILGSIYIKRNIGLGIFLRFLWWTFGRTRRKKYYELIAQKAQHSTVGKSVIFVWIYCIIRKSVFSCVKKQEQLSKSRTSRVLQRIFLVFFLLKTSAIVVKDYSWRVNSVTQVLKFVSFLDLYSSDLFGFSLLGR